MSYEVIEKNEYGVLVKNTKEESDCELCEHSKKELLITLCIKKHGCVDYSYYITDKESAKLETENQKPLADEIINIQKDKINMLEETLEKIIDSQKELIDLQIENKQLKERINELESEKSTEIESKYLSDYNTTIHSCKKCNTEILRTSYNFCPNCGREIIKK